ncbi:MAG: hypothetical protein JWP94_3344 [Mucilaginibacter sp.]|nr:hypothetical protein [Mucilaginibacter sp.]
MLQLQLPFVTNIARNALIAGCIIKILIYI